MPRLLRRIQVEQFDDIEYEVTVKMDMVIMLLCIMWEEQLRGSWIELKDTTGLVRIAYISEMKRKGELAPVEYSAPGIKDMIVSARKQALVTDLEQDLLNDARENGKFKIYR